MSSESPPEENELGLGLINRYRHKIKKERKKNGNSKDAKQGKQQFLNPLT